MDGRTLGTPTAAYDHLGARAVGAARAELGLASGTLAIALSEAELALIVMHTLLAPLPPGGGRGSESALPLPI